MKKPSGLTDFAASIGATAGTLVAGFRTAMSDQAREFRDDMREFRNELKDIGKRIIVEPVCRRAENHGLDHVGVAAVRRFVELELRIARKPRPEEPEPRA